MRSYELSANNANNAKKKPSANKRKLAQAGIRAPVKACYQQSESLCGS